MKRHKLLHLTVIRVDSDQSKIFDTNLSYASTVFSLKLLTLTCHTRPLTCFASERAPLHREQASIQFEIGRGAGYSSNMTLHAMIAECCHVEGIVTK